VVASVPTTRDGETALRQTLRIEFVNHGEEASAPMAIHVGASNGTGLATHAFTLVAVAAVNAPIVMTLGETRIRNEYLVGIYERFGDTGLMGVDDDGNPKRLAYNVDWRALPDDPASHLGTDIRVLDGSVRFALGFTADLPVCDGPGRVWGSFTLQPDAVDASILRLEWLDGPHHEVNADTFCALGSLGISELIIAGAKIVMEIRDGTTAAIRANLEQALGFPGGMRQVPFTRFLAAEIGDGRIDVHAAIPIPHVRIRTTQAYMVDRTANPGYAMALPTGIDVLLASGGLYQSTSYPYAPDPAEHGALLLDAGGAFNWAEDETVPVPNPWESASGRAAYFPERHEVWQRLQGIVRDPAKLPSRRAPGGALLARLGSVSSLDPRRVAAVADAPACVVRSRSEPGDGLLVGLNDDPQIDGTSPAWGSLDVSVVIPASEGEAGFFFGDVPDCPLAPAEPAAVARASLDDNDSDGVLDTHDNCPLWPNDQSDTDQNGIGNGCECCDQTGDGRVSIQDLIAINRAIFAPSLATPLCDTNDDDLCNAADLIGANRRIFGAPAHCSRNPAQP
jgi:hypothetical protein